MRKVTIDFEELDEAIQERPQYRTGGQVWLVERLRNSSVLRRQFYAWPESEKKETTISVRD